MRVFRIRALFACHEELIQKSLKVSAIKILDEHGFLHKSGKCQISNKCVKSLDIEKEMEMRLIYLPQIQKCDRLDFFKC